jgi:malate dehydrogenase
MRTVVILGAGELGATLARRLAGGPGRVVLVDPDEGKAKGKALDILQSGPVDGFDTRIEGAADAAGFSEPDIAVAADHPDLAGGAAADRAAALLKAIRPRFALVALARSAAAVDALLGAGFPGDRVAGSAPVAVEAALRRRLAAALDVAPKAVSLALAGLPPDAIVVPHASASVGGAPLDGLGPAALRQAVQETSGRTPGPVALASAAAAVIAALAAPRASVLCVMARADDAAAGIGRATVALPRRIANGRIGAALVLALEPYERVALQNAAEGRLPAAARARRPD